MLESRPLASSGQKWYSSQKWYHWVIALFTYGLSLAVTVPLANQRRTEAQRKIDGLWEEYSKLSKLERERLSGYGHLLEPQAVVSTAGGVVLQEARQGDTVTKTDGDIKLRGGTGTVGVGVAIGPVGIGGAQSNTSLKGTMSSTGVTITGQDRASDIDEGQLKFVPAGLQFVGKLQVRELPVDTILNVSSDGSVLIVASTVSSFAQRFRFKESFEREVFDTAISAAIRNSKFPDMAQLEKDLVTIAANYVAMRKSSLEDQMRKLAHG
jgi:hypothetical protein